MPRKRKTRTANTESVSEPVPISDVLSEVKDRFPEAFAAGEAAKHAEPHEPAPASESPPFEPTAPRPKSWGETVRPHESYPTAGIERVETTSPNMTGIRFADSRKRTRDEKVEMEAAGLSYWNQTGSWLEKATPEARDRTKAMARSFAERRKAEDAREWDR